MSSVSGQGVLTAHLHGRDAGFSGAEQAGGGAVAEQRRGSDDVFLSQLVEAEREGAKFHRDNQNDAARPGLRKPGTDRYSEVDAAGAAEAEDGDAFDIRVKAHAPGDAGFQAGGRDTGR